MAAVAFFAFAERRGYAASFPEPDGVKPNFQSYPRHQQAELKTRVSVVYQEECYELVVGGGAHKRIQRFGIPYGTNRVVLCVVPNPDLYIPSEERSRIVPRALTGEEGAGLPWDDWSRQFVANMPQSIRDYVEQCAVGTRVQGMQELFERARTAWRFAAHSSSQGDGHQGGSNLADPASKPSEGKKKPKNRREPSEDERERTSNPREGGTGSRQGNRRNGFSLPNIDWVRDADLPEGDPCRGQAGFYAHNTLDGPLLKLNEDWGGLATWRACVAEAHPGWREHRITQATRAVWQLLAVELVLRNRAFDRDVPSPTEIGDCFQQRMARDLILDAMNPRG